MKDKDLKKDILFIKVKRNKHTGPSVRREFIYSNLNDYEKINKIIKEALFLLRKKEISNDSIVLKVLYHPKYNEIYFDSKEQWDLLYKYNIIDECISNQSLKIDFIICDKKKYNSINENNKKEIMKYIIQNIPINLFFNFFINFLRKRKDISDEFEKYLINDLLSNNMDIDKTQNNKKYNINKNVEDENKNIINIKEYFINYNKFLDTLNNKFEIISKNQKYLNSFLKIKNIFHEDKEKNENSSINIKNNPSRTFLDLNPRASLDSLLDEDDDILTYKNNYVMKTVLNPPTQYVKNLMDDKNFFKKIEKKEYYLGIENYKDELIRESMDFLKNTKLY